MTRSTKRRFSLRTTGRSTCGPCGRSLRIDHAEQRHRHQGLVAFDPPPPPPPPRSTEGGGIISCGDHWEISKGEKFAPLPNPKAYTASRTRCTAKAPGSRQGKSSPRALKTKSSHDIIPLCDIPSGCYSFTGPWTVTRSSLRMLRRVAAFCWPLRPVLLLVLFPRSRSPVVGVPGLCWMWRDVPFARQRRPRIIPARHCPPRRVGAHRGAEILQYPPKPTRPHPCPNYRETAKHCQRHGTLCDVLVPESGYPNICTSK